MGGQVPGKGYGDSPEADRPGIGGFKPDSTLVRRHTEWLKPFDKRHTKLWNRLLEDDPQAAMCEAEFVRVLQDNGVIVEPNADLDNSRPAPDFRCSKNGERFYVEVTCMHIDRVTEETCLPHLPVPGVAAYYRRLTASLFEEVRQKTPQCARLDAPALVAIGTFHLQASHRCVNRELLKDLLTGDTRITQQINIRDEISIGDPYLSTKLESAAFFRPADGPDLDHARCPVSGILVAGFGGYQNILGLLHPNPVRPFNRELLPRIEFGRVTIDDAGRKLSVQWV